MQPGNHGLHMALGLALASLPVGSTSADVILLRPEIAGLKAVINCPTCLSGADRVALRSLSRSGTDLLYRGRSVAAVVISDSGRWTYRIEGDVFSTPLAESTPLTTDAANITTLLRSRTVIDIISIRPSDQARLELSERAESFKARLKALGSSSAIQANPDLRDSLLTQLGEELRADKNGLGAAVASDASVRSQANVAMALAAARQSDVKALVGEYLAEREDSKFAVAPEELPEHWMGAITANAELSNRVGAFVYFASDSTGTYAFTCKPPESSACVESNNEVNKDNVDKAIFLPKDRAIPDTAESPTTLPPAG